MFITIQKLGMVKKMISNMDFNPLAFIKSAIFGFNIIYCLIPIITSDSDNLILL